MLMRTNKPRTGRVHTSFPATILVDGGPKVHGRVLNLSKSGFRLRLDAPLAVGDRILIDCEGIRSKGQVIWACGTEAGGRFLEGVQLEPSIGRL